MKKSSDLHITALAGRRFMPFLRKHLPRAARLLPLPMHEVSVVLVGDRRMARLHEQFLGIPGPTDVLTFPVEHNAKGHVIAGEIIICIPEAARSASRLGSAAEREVLLYAVHGLLHLQGYDDRTDRGFQTMHRTEDAILTRLGLGPQFHVPSRRQARNRG